MQISFSDFDKFPYQEIDFFIDHVNARRLTLRVGNGSGNYKDNFTVHAFYFRKHPQPNKHVDLATFPFTFDGLKDAVRYIHNLAPPVIRTHLMISDKVVE